MTKEEIGTGNRLIAEFMGGAFEDKEIYAGNLEECTNVNHLTQYDAWSTNNQIWIPVSRLKYHCKWDWLMPVVEKIQKEYPVICLLHDNRDGYGEYVEILVHRSNGFCKMFYWYDYDRLKEVIEKDGPAAFRVIVESKIQATWLAVTEFINWHNQKQ